MKRPLLLAGAALLLAGMSLAAYVPSRAKVILFSLRPATHSAAPFDPTAPIIVAVEGDSRTAPPAPAVSFWPDYLPELWTPAAGGLVNFGHGGDPLASMVTQYETEAHRVTPKPGQIGYFVLIGGANDLGTGMNATAAQTYEAAKTLWAKARADGFVVIASTETGAHRWPARNTAECAAYNRLVRSDPTRYDALVEPDAGLPFSAWRYYIDAVHLTDTGARTFAEMVARALASVSRQH